MMQAKKDIPTLWTSNETAEYLRVSLDCLRRMRKDRRIKFVRLGRRVRFDPADVRSVLRQG